jgi:transposase InsO family protein
LQQVSSLLSHLPIPLHSIPPPLPEEAEDSSAELEERVSALERSIGDISKKLEQVLQQQQQVFQSYFFGTSARDFGVTEPKSNEVKHADEPISTKHSSHLQELSGVHPGLRSFVSSAPAASLAQILPHLPRWSESWSDAEDFLAQFEIVLEGAHIRDDNDKRSALLMAVRDNAPLRQFLIELPARSSWSSIRDSFKARTQLSLSAHFAAFESIRMERNEDISTYINRFRHQASRLDIKDNDERAATTFIKGLPKYLQPAVQSARFTISASQSTRKPQGQTSLEELFRFTFMIAPSVAPSVPSHASACSFCGFKGHEMSECRKLKSQQRASQGSSPTEVKTSQGVNNRRNYSQPKCSSCGQAGHFAARCQVNKPKTSQPAFFKSASRRPQANATSRRESDSQTLTLKRLSVFPHLPAAALPSIVESLPQLSQSGPGMSEARPEHTAFFPFQPPPPPILLPIQLDGKVIMAELDTGAGTSYIDRTFAHQLGLQLIPTKVKMAGVDTRMGVQSVYGGVECDIQLQNQDSKHRHVFAVVDNPSMPVTVGRDLMSQLRIAAPIPLLVAKLPTLEDITFEEDSHVPEVHADDITLHESLLKELQPLLEENQQLPANSFCNIPDSDVTIEVTDATPYSVASPPVPHALRELLDRKLQKLIDEDRIESSPPTAYELPFFGIPKRGPNGELADVRPILDCRALNKLIKGDTFPIPDGRALLEDFAQCIVFSELDSQDAFFRLLVRPQSRRFLAFRYRHRQYRYRSAPMGMKNIPAHFQRVMDRILGDLPFVKIFIDNIMVGSRSWEDHVEHLKIAISRLTAANFTLNLKKCKFGRRSLRVLGHLLSKEGVSPDLSKIQAIANWPVPKTGKQIQRFLGFANFIRVHVPNAADVFQPLEKLKNLKRIPAAELEPMRIAFDALRQVLVKAPLLRFPDLAKQFCIMVDASNLGVGAVLFQPKHEFEMPRIGNIVCFYSRGLKKHELNYPTYKKELLAVLLSLRKWRDYLWNSTIPCRIFTDHKPLVALFTQKLNTVLANWMEHISEFNFELFHVDGVKNIIADCLSRQLDLKALKTLPGPDVSSSKTSPTKQQRQLIEAAHRKGHYGIKAVLYDLQVRQKMKWPHQAQHIASIIGECPQCQLFSRHRPRYVALSYSAAKAPWTQLQIDLITSFPNGIVLTIVDTFTGYLIARAIPNKEASTIADCLYQIFADFGIPREVQTDQGSEFIGEAFRLINATFQVRIGASIAHNPRRQGAVERSNATIASSLRKMLAEAKEHWEDLLPLAQLYYNSKLFQTTGISPFELLFARPSRLQQDGENPSLNLEDWRAHQARMITIFYPHIEKNVVDAKLQRAIQFARTHLTLSPINFHEGQRVMLLDATRSSKNEPTYSGPFTIARRMNDHSFLLKDQDGNIQPFTAAAHQLKIVG